MIYHILKKSSWESHKNSIYYKTHSLDREGFIHCSFEEQVVKVANTLYKGSTDLLVLCINEDKIKQLIKVEDLYHLNEDYPHVYGEIPLNAVEKVVNLELLNDGTFKKPNLSSLSSLKVPLQEWT